MLGNCWLVKKLPNYELFLTNSSPEAFTNLWQYTLYNCWALIDQQHLVNLVGNLLPSSWIILGNERLVENYEEIFTIQKFT